MGAQGYTSSQLSLLTNNIEAVPNVMAYNAVSLSAGNTGDSIATIQGTNYFTDGQKRGMALGNPVWVITDYVGGAGVPITHPCYVSAVQLTSAGYGATVTLCPGNS